MQFYQKRRENCVKTHVILKKASFYACLTLFAGMAFPMPLWASLSTAIVQQHVKQITGIVKDANGDPVDFWHCTYHWSPLLLLGGLAGYALVRVMQIRGILRRKKQEA